jgi:K+-transporting ATPase ATPase C chain
MRREMVIALRALLLTLIATGGVYPLAVTLASSALFFQKAKGSIVEDANGNPLGSELIAQPFANPAYFQPRPLSASNLGPTSKKLRDRAAGDVVRLRAENVEQTAPVPLELVTASASGLDPHLSPKGALWQAPRIARARGVSVDRVNRIVLDNESGRELGLFGEATINVLMLNLALDQAFGRPHNPAR